MGVDADPVLVALHRAFQHIAHAELPADLPGVDVLALEAEGGIAGDHEAIVDARQIGRQILRDAVREIILARVVREIGEGEDNDREPRGLGRHRRNGRWAVRNEEIPAGRRDHDKRDNSYHQRRQRRLLFRFGRLPGRLRLGRWLRLRWLAHFERIDPNRIGDVLELRRPKIGHGEIEPPLHLPIGLFGQTDRARRGDALQSRRDVDAVAHQVAVALLDDVAKVDADAEDDAAILGHAGIALDHGVLNFDGAAHGVDDAAKFDDRAVAGALDHAPVMHGDSRVDEVAAQRPQPRQDAILVRAGKRL